MKNKRTLLVVLLTLVCLVCGAIGLAACKPEPEPEPTPGPATVVIKVGETNIGTVTAEGSTYGVQGEADTVYKVTAKANGEVSEGVLISLGDTTLGTGYSTFTYVADCKLTFKAVSASVENVTVVMEKYVEPSIPVPSATTYTLTVDKPVVLASIKAGDTVTVKVATEEGKTYTVTSDNDNVKIVDNLGNKKVSYTFNGSEYVELNNVATLRLAAESDAQNVIVTLTVKDTEDPGAVTYDFPVLTLGTSETPELGEEPYCFYQIALRAGTYKVIGEISLGSAENYADIEIGGGLEGDEIYPQIEINYNNGNFTVEEAGTYVIKAWAEDYFAIYLVLTDEAPLVLTDIKESEIISLAVETAEDKTYTVTLSNQNVLFVGNYVQGNYPGPYTFNGIEYVVLNNIATVRLIAEGDVASLTVTLSVTDYEEGGADASNGCISYANENFDFVDIVADDNTVVLGIGEYELTCTSFDYEPANYTFKFTKIA